MHVRRRQWQSRRAKILLLGHAEQRPLVTAKLASAHVYQENFPFIAMSSTSDSRLAASYLGLMLDDLYLWVCTGCNKHSRIFIYSCGKKWRRSSYNCRTQGWYGNRSGRNWSVEAILWLGSRREVLRKADGSFPLDPIEFFLKNCTGLRASYESGIEAEW